MRILALDLGVRTGFAFGEAGAAPRSGVVTLKDRDDKRDVAFGNLIAWLDKLLREDRPDLVLREAPLNLQAFRTLDNAAFTVRVTLGLHAIVEGICQRFGTQAEEVPDATIRKHFIGRANCGGRPATKAAVIQRCHVLGYMRRDCADDNRADALATFDYAAATFGKRAPRELVLFGASAA